jgi:hypothetical protein
MNGGPPRIAPAAGAPQSIRVARTLAVTLVVGAAARAGYAEEVRGGVHVDIRGAEA